MKISGSPKLREKFGLNVYFTNLTLMVHFYTPWKRQKASSFLKFSGGVAVEHWYEMGELMFFTWDWGKRMRYEETLVIKKRNWDLLNSVETNVAII